MIFSLFHFLFAFGLLIPRLAFVNTVRPDAIRPFLWARSVSRCIPIRKRSIRLSALVNSHPPSLLSLPLALSTIPLSRSISFFQFSFAHYVSGIHLKKKFKIVLLDFISLFFYFKTFLHFSFTLRFYHSFDLSIVNF